MKELRKHYQAGEKVAILRLVFSVHGFESTKFKFRLSPLTPDP